MKEKRFEEPIAPHPSSLTGIEEDRHVTVRQNEASHSGNRFHRLPNRRGGNDQRHGSGANPGPTSGVVRSGDPARSRRPPPRPRRTSIIRFSTTPPDAISSAMPNPRSSRAANMKIMETEQQSQRPGTSPDRLRAAPQPL